MNVLSLFDGISIAHKALLNLTIPHKYYAVEIDKFPRTVGGINFNISRELGNDITKLDLLPKIDLLVVGNSFTLPVIEFIFRKL